MFYWANPHFLRFRLWCFRFLIFVSALAAVGGWGYHRDFKTDDAYPQLYAIATAVFGHHIVCALVSGQRKRFSSFDLPLDCGHALLIWAEFICMVAYFQKKIHNGKIDLKPWHPGLFVAATCSVYTLLITLGFWWLMTVLWAVSVLSFPEMAYEGGRAAQIAFCFRPMPDRYPHWCINPWTILMSNTPGRRIYTNEHKYITRSRAFFAVSSLVVLFLFGSNAIFVGPFQAVGFPSSKRTIADSFPLDDKMKVPVWSIIAYTSLHVVQDATDQTTDPTTFYQALDVSVLKDPSESTDFICERPRSEPYLLDADRWVANPYKFGTMAISVNCHSLGAAMKTASDVYTTRAAIVSPELLITFNFNTFGLDVNDTRGRTSRKVISIVVGLTDNVLDAIASSDPVALYPGLNLVGGVSRNFRSRFQDPKGSVLGIFPQYRSFFFATVTNLVPDREFSASAETATLRLYDLYEQSQWSIFNDHYDNTVLGGFAALGGFFSFQNAIFATVFGGSLMFVAFGVRPMSLLGLVHSMQRGEPDFRLRHPDDMPDNDLQRLDAVERLLNGYVIKLTDVGLFSRADGAAGHRGGPPQDQASPATDQSRDLLPASTTSSATAQDTTSKTSRSSRHSDLAEGSGTSASPKHEEIPMERLDRQHIQRQDEQEHDGEIATERRQAFESAIQPYSL